MKKLSLTIAKLSAIKSAVSPHVGASPTRLESLTLLDTNPGALKAKIYVPKRLADRPALVVVLHGCTQTADGYDLGSGWSQLADEHGFVLLYPEQQQANNANLCFNWFSPVDNLRDRGEPMSIRQMIAGVTSAYDIDPVRIFITGLSAGGAMTSILLATYPEIFAGGAIIAGLPYGSASNVPQALTAMRDPGSYTGVALGDRVRGASAHAGAWPKISIWHGARDATVNASNADAILAQWLSVHGFGHTPTAIETIAGHRLRVWHDAAGRPVVEDYRIANMGHGTPLATTGVEACGRTMPHMLEAGISSTRRIAASWGLLADDNAKAPARIAEEKQDLSHDVPIAKGARLERLNPVDPHPPAAAKTGVEKIITDALRTAGLIH